LEQLEALETVLVVDGAGSGGEAAGQRVAAVRRNRDGVDLDDAHDTILPGFGSDEASTVTWVRLTVRLDQSGRMGHLVSTGICHLLAALRVETALRSRRVYRRTAAGLGRRTIVREFRDNDLTANRADVVRLEFEAMLAVLRIGRLPATRAESGVLVGGTRPFGRLPNRLTLDPNEALPVLWSVKVLLGNPRLCGWRRINGELVRDEAGATIAGSGSRSSPQNSGRPSMPCCGTAGVAMSARTAPLDRPWITPGRGPPRLSPPAHRLPACGRILPDRERLRSVPTREPAAELHAPHLYLPRPGPGRRRWPRSRSDKVDTSVSEEILAKLSEEILAKLKECHATTQALQGRTDADDPGV
jgi:hypothetical protein